MNREKQAVKDLENKQAQISEEYEKNKHLLAETKLNEKDYFHPEETEKKKGKKS